MEGIVNPFFEDKPVLLSHSVHVADQGLCTRLKGHFPGGEMTLASTPSSTGALTAEVDTSSFLATEASGGMKGQFGSNN